MSATVSAKPPAAPLEKLGEELLDSYLGDERARRIAQRYLPSREAIVEILESVLDLMYPGYFGRQDLNRENLGAHVAQMLAALAAQARARNGALPVLRARARSGAAASSANVRRAPTNSRRFFCGGCPRSAAS